MSDCRFGVSPVNYPNPDSLALNGDSEDSDQTGQADLSLRLAYSHIVSFVISRLIF